MQIDEISIFKLSKWKKWSNYGLQERKKFMQEYNHSILHGLTAKSIYQIIITKIFKMGWAQSYDVTNWENERAEGYWEKAKIFLCHNKSIQNIYSWWIKG